MNSENFILILLIIQFQFIFFLLQIRFDEPLIYLYNSVVWTGGKFHLFFPFDKTNSEQLHLDIFNTLASDYYWDVQVCLRASKEIQFTKLITNGWVEDDSLVYVPAASSDESIQYSYSINSSTGNQRIIRVITFNIPFSSDLHLIWKNIDEDFIKCAFLEKLLIKFLAQMFKLRTVSCKPQFQIIAHEEFILVHF